MKNKPINIAIIGCGNMGSALLHNWIDKKIGSKIFIYDPFTTSTKKDENTFYYNVKKDFSNKLDEVNIVVFAVKPQILKEACNEFDAFIAKDTPIISIAAGQDTNTIQAYFNFDRPIIRVMPNTPAAIGKGISVAYANSKASDEHISITEKLFLATGYIKWIEDEDLMNAVTAISGSGPAYIFHFIEALTAAGEKAGLDKNLAALLAKETLIGSAYLIEQNADKSIKTLRENVTSPGGTTEAALSVLMDESKLKGLIEKAVISAKKRGSELSSS